MKKNNDHRKNNRLSVQSLVEIYPVFPSYREWLAESGVNYLAGHLSDLSRGGMGLTLKKPLKKGSILKFHFSLRGNRQVEIFGKLVWTSHLKAGARFYLLSGRLSQTGVALPFPARSLLSLT